MALRVFLTFGRRQLHVRNLHKRLFTTGEHLHGTSNLCASVMETCQHGCGGDSDCTVCVDHSDSVVLWEVDFSPVRCWELQLEQVVLWRSRKPQTPQLNLILSHVERVHAALRRKRNVSHCKIVWVFFTWFNPCNVKSQSYYHFILESTNVNDEFNRFIQSGSYHRPWDRFCSGALQEGWWWRGRGSSLHPPRHILDHYGAAVQSTIFHLHFASEAWDHRGAIDIVEVARLSSHPASVSAMWLAHLFRL